MVRYYTTQRVNGGITFQCAFCEHAVTTRNFDDAKGNCRTQAATAMNQHAVELHASLVQKSSASKSSDHGGF
jgi:hypothetical protein